MNARGVSRFVSSLQRRVMLMIARAAVKRVDDSGPQQRLQLVVLAGEPRDDVLRAQDYGFTSHAFPGAGAVLLALAGNRDAPVAIGVEDGRYRLRNLQPGEVALYDDQAQKIVLYRDRIEIEAPKVVVQSPEVHLGEEGGPPVARIGDLVHVGGGSSRGFWPIVEGSSTVRAGGAKTGGS